VAWCWSTCATVPSDIAVTSAAAGRMGRQPSQPAGLPVVARPASKLIALASSTHLGNNVIGLVPASEVIEGVSRPPRLLGSAPGAVDTGEDAEGNDGTGTDGRYPAPDAGADEPGDGGGHGATPSYVRRDRTHCHPA
jgi:hypothetical protein